MTNLRHLQTLLLILLTAMAPWAGAQTSLLEISNGRHQVMIGGGVQFLSRDDYPLPLSFEIAYNIADKVHFQTDLDAISKPGFGLRAMQHMSFRNGRTLRSVLSPLVWQALRTFSRERDLPSTSLIMFQPALAVTTLSVLEARRLGSGRGRMGTSTGALNAPGSRWATWTVDRQLLFLSRLNELNPDTLVTATLSELRTMEAQSGPVVSAWCQGDMAELDRLIGTKIRAEAPELYRSLVTERNRQWLEQIVAMLERPELDYMLVDAMHLSGPGNLLELLEDHGLEVRPLVL